MTIASLLALLVTSTAAPLLDSPGARSHWDTLVQPATYVSPSGSFRLHVRSLQRDWRAGAHFRLEHGERVVWESDLPFVLWDAKVLEGGSVVGFGFRDSEERATGDLFMAAMFAGGQIAWQHVEPNQARTVGMTACRSYVARDWCVHDPKAFPDEEAPPEVDLEELPRGPSTLRNQALGRVSFSWFVDAARGGTLSIAGDWVLWGTRLIHWLARSVRTVSCDDGQVIHTPREPELWVRGSNVDGPGHFRRFKVHHPG